MAYDQELAERLRDTLHAAAGLTGTLTERRMFGGLAFLVNGNMAVAASGQGGLLLRVDPQLADSLIEPPHVGPFVMRGRELTGWLRVDAAAVTTDAELARWTSYGIGYARGLPAK